MNIITGEKLQQLCDIYLGLQEDFYYNPVIQQQTKKQFDLNYLNSDFENPYYIFCYSHRIYDLSNKIHLFKNKFTLVTHNSDYDIRNEKHILNVLESTNLDKWYAQNICFHHSKLYFLPIGIANSMWSHGNLISFNSNVVLHNINNKSKNFYFNFKIDTNKINRTICFNSLINKLEWLNNISHTENIIRLSQYRFCICPEGNGVDTHRLWECLYLKVVPIVIKSDFTEILNKNNIPLVILNSWDNFDESILNYDSFDFENVNFTKIINFNNSYLT